MGPLSITAFVIIAAVKVIAVFTVIMITVAMLTLAERRIAAWIQDRSGPNRVGPWGILQPFADGLKNLVKEETMPAAASRGLFILAPMISMFPALVLFAVIPFGSPLPTRWGLVNLIIADLPIGFLYVLALGSLGVYGIVLGGWASNSKYALLGGLRASAQMISYEVGLGLSLVPILMLTGNVALTEVVGLQQDMGLWFFFPLMLSYLIFAFSYFAETNRLPFDLPEAESELVTGYHTEYSSMKFSMFFIAEYSNMLTASALTVTFFFGGWDIPFWSGDNMRVLADGTVVGASAAVWKSVLTMLVFAAKVGFFVFVFIWVRWTIPRFRYDQVMALGWKVLIPVAVVYIAVLGAAMLLLEARGFELGFLYGLVLTALNVLLVVAFLFVLDRGRIITGSWDPRRRARVRSRRLVPGARSG
ncbi:MAG: NADH-quinone oxidoreductase subunit NuoH [Gemmatimonadota bacterium]